MIFRESFTMNREEKKQHMRSFKKGSFKNNHYQSFGFDLACL